MVALVGITGNLPILAQSGFRYSLPVTLDRQMDVRSFCHGRHNSKHISAAVANTKANELSPPTKDHRSLAHFLFFGKYTTDSPENPNTGGGLAINDQVRGGVFALITKDDHCAAS